MELDELKAGWAVLDERLGRIESHLAAERIATAQKGVRAELRPLLVGQVIQIVFGGWMALAAGTFWVEHRYGMNLLVTGLLLHGYGIAAMVAGARNLLLISRVRESAPVLELQRRVAALRAWRIREGWWFGVVGCFMWVAMVAWGFGLLGVDIVALRPGFMGLQLLAAVVCLVVFLIATRRQTSPEGSSVRKARERLDEIARFEGG